MRRALLSVSDKTDLAEFARQLVALGIELVSTGGTFKALRDADLPVKTVEEVTGFPEMLDGRVKTLHPRIHAGILARRDSQEHMATLRDIDLKPIDLVVCNLYPFAQTIASVDCTLAEAIENIDIGGPSMVRAAAKNHAAVAVVTNPCRYREIIDALRQYGEIPLPLRQVLALEAFSHTAHYDALVAEYLRKQYSPQEMFPETVTLTFNKVQDLRYGENPHQAAAFYREVQFAQPSMAGAKQLQGKELSYCNINDADAAINLVSEFAEPAAVAIKHANPCGVACGPDVLTAYRRAHDADPVSIFGGIVAVNRCLDEETAHLMRGIFLDIIIAPAFSEEAIKILATKKNLRLLQVDGLGAGQATGGLHYHRVGGGLLVQTRDIIRPEDEKWQTVTRMKLVASAKDDLMFAIRVAKHAKSNAIVVAKDKVTLGIGVGQVNRIDAARHALSAAGAAARGAVLVSEALLPFADVVEAAAAGGIAALAQPGGALRDEEVINRADELGLAMVFTGYRHFRH